MDLECNAVVGQVVGEMKAVSGVSILERISPRRPTCRPLHRRSGVGRFYNLCREIAEMALRAVPPWHESRNDVCGLRNRGICARSPLTSFRVTNLPRGCELFNPIYDIRTCTRRTCIMPTSCFSFSSVFRLFPFPLFFSRFL